MNDRDLENPIITQTERDGLPDRCPHCPICGRETDEVYFDGLTIIGCPECIETKNAWETEACFPEGERL